MAGINPKDVLTGIESTLTASPTLVNATTLKEIVIGRYADHSSGFPFVRIYLATFNDPVADTISYELTYTVMVEIWQDNSVKDKRNAELDLANALHAVLNRLSGTWQLGLDVKNTTISGGQIREDQLNSAPMLVAPIRLDVLTLLQNPT